MPIHEYSCPACGNQFEEIVKSGSPAPICPKCGASTERKLSVPSPLKTGAFPYKVGPVRPMGNGMPGGCAGGACGSGGCGGGDSGQCGAGSCGGPGCACA